MILGKVTGTVISTQKDGGLQGHKLLIVQTVKLPDMEPSSAYNVAIDNVGAGVGEYVITVAGSSARIAEGLKEKPVDTTIIGIVDVVQIDGKTLYSKRPEGAAK
jgi:microcompartment protein CcmK/EutM